MSERKPHSDDALLAELASAIADHTPVDWEALRRDRPELRTDLDRLARIERVAAGWRATTPAGAANQATAARPLFAWGPLLALERIGEGTFGRVYRAFDPRLDREVALKLLHSPEGGTASLRRALDEAKLQARVRHPNVLVIHGADVHDGRVGMWTDLVSGETLERALERGETFPPDEVVAIGLDLCGALAAVHRAGLVHGDVTLRNIMRDRDGRILLMDFGSSGDADSGAHGVSGTPLYLAPEILSGGPAGAASDLYSLGVALYRLVSGRYPFSASTFEQLRGIHESHRSPAPPDPAPPLLTQVIETALRRDPRARFSGASSMEAALRSITRGAHDGSARAPGNLFAPVTSFVGRTQHIEAVRKVLSSSRLVSLIGAGGCGKSRLALQVLLHGRAAYPDGAWIVELAGVARGSLVAQTIARELGIPEETGRTALECITGRLSNRKLVLLLDNCEHVLDACARVSAEIAESCPEVRILATSREPLGIAGERAYAVPPLDVPEPGEDPAKVVESVELFHERARAVDPHVDLTGRSAPAVAETCRRLDGIPLAIELAASRVRTLTPSEIAAGLADRFQLLAGDHVGRLPHHRTLEALIDWSYELLTHSERTCLARLAVFSGGWSRDAAERVCAGGVLDVGLVPDVLAHLVDKSLIERVRGDDSTRYRMLESIREYAGRRLAESGERTAVADAHLDHAVEFAERLQRGLHTDEQERWTRIGARDHDNVRAGLDHAIETGRIEAGLRLASAMWRFWDLRGHWSEALAYYEALARDERSTGAPDLRAEAFHNAARIAYRMGDLDRAGSCCHAALEGLSDARGSTQRMRYLNTLGVIESTRGRMDAAIRLHEEGLAAARHAADARMTAVARGNLAILFALRGQFDAAREHYAAMLPAWAELGDTQESGRTLTNLAQVELMRARYDEALVHIKKAEAIQRDIDDLGTLAETLLHRAFVLIERGDTEAARKVIDEALALGVRVGNTLEVARAHEMLGTIAMQIDDLGEAASRIRTSLEIRRDAGEVANVAASVETAARLEIRRGRPLRAATMLAATAALRSEIGWITPRAVSERIEAARAELKRDCGAKELARAVLAGAGMSPEEVTAFALDSLSESRS